MKIVALLLFGIANVAFSFYLDFPITPDDFRWSGKTCSYELKTDKALKVKIRTWNLTPPVDAKHKCFVRCMMTYLNLYDPTTGIVSKKPVEKQFEARGLGKPVKTELLEGATNGTCEGVFAKAVPFIMANSEKYMKAFYGDKTGKRTEEKEWYKKNRDKKAIGVKASQYCQKKFPKDKCKKVECTYHFYRLVDRANGVISDRLFEGVYDINIDKLLECQKEADAVPSSQGCKLSMTLKNCMEKKDKKKWRKFMKFLDDVSADNKYPDN